MQHAGIRQENRRALVARRGRAPRSSIHRPIARASVRRWHGALRRTPVCGRVAFTNDTPDHDHVLLIAGLARRAGPLALARRPCVGAGSGGAAPGPRQLQPAALAPRDRARPRRRAVAAPVRPVRDATHPRAGRRRPAIDTPRAYDEHAPAPNRPRARHGRHPDRRHSPDTPARGSITRPDRNRRGTDDAHAYDASAHPSSADRNRYPLDHPRRHAAASASSHPSTNPPTRHGGERTGQWLAMVARRAGGRPRGRRDAPPAPSRCDQGHHRGAASAPRNRAVAPPRTDPATHGSRQATGQANAHARASPRTRATPRPHRGDPVATTRRARGPGTRRAAARDRPRPAPRARRAQPAERARRG